jgi:hypothetical protein
VAGIALALSIVSTAVSVITVIVTVTLWRRESWEVVVDPIRWHIAWHSADDFRGTPDVEVTNVGRMACVLAAESETKIGDSLTAHQPAIIVPRGRGELPYALAPSETIHLSWPLPDMEWSQTRLVTRAGRRSYPSEWSSKERLHSEAHMFDEEDKSSVNQEQRRPRRPRWRRWGQI